MTTTPVCFESENQSVCLHPDQGDVLMSLPPEPDQTTMLAAWTPRDQVEWNRINKPVEGRGGPQNSSLGRRPPKILGLPFFLAGCGGGNSSEETQPDKPTDECVVRSSGDPANGQPCLGGPHSDHEDCVVNIPGDSRDGLYCYGDEDLDNNSNRTDRCPTVGRDNPNGGRDLILGLDGCPSTCSHSDGGPDVDRDGQLAPGCGGQDCDDYNDTVYSGAPEIAGNTIDENCNGMGDADRDADGVTERAGDCQDDDDTINPDAEEIRGNRVDENCNGMEDADADNDGLLEEDGDCDDLNPEIPRDNEVCFDEDDNNCDGQTDEGCVCDTVNYTGPEGIYGVGEESITGFDSDVTDACTDYLPGSANASPFFNGQDFWIDASYSDNFCIGAWGACISPDFDECIEYGGNYAAVSTLYTSESTVVNVNCGTEGVNNTPKTVVFLKAEDCSLEQQLVSGWWYVSPSFADGFNTDGLVYFASAGNVPFRCHVSMSDE